MLFLVNILKNTLFFHNHSLEENQNITHCNFMLLERFCWDRDAMAERIKCGGLGHGSFQPSSVCACMHTCKVCVNGVGMLFLLPINHDYVYVCICVKLVWACVGACSIHRVCVCVCVCVCVKCLEPTCWSFALTILCVNVYMSACSSACMSVCSSPCIYVYMYVCMYVPMYSIYVYMYVCIQVCIYLCI